MTAWTALRRALTARGRRRAHLDAAERWRATAQDQTRLNGELLVAIARQDGRIAELEAALAARGERVKELKSDLAAKTSVAIAAAQALVTAKHQARRLAPVEPVVEAVPEGGEAA